MITAIKAKWNTFKFHLFFPSVLDVILFAAFAAASSVALLYLFCQNLF